MILVVVNAIYALLHKKPEKIQDVNRIWTHDLVIQRERERLL